MKANMAVGFVAGLLLIAMVSGCMPDANTVVNTPGTEGSIAGFWLGLWHGMIAPISWLVSLFSNTINVYEVHNNGGWYNFGFCLGAGIIFKSSSEASSRVTKR